MAATPRYAGVNVAVLKYAHSPQGFTILAEDESHLVDQDSTTKWACDFMPCQAAIDLGTPVWISKIVITHAGTEDSTVVTCNFDVLTSLDNQTYVSVCPQVGGLVENRSDPSMHDFAPRLARWVQMSITKGEQTGSIYGGNSARIYAIDVYTCSPPLLARAARWTAATTSASGTSGTLAASTAGGAAALAGTSTVNGTLTPSGTGTAALAGTSTINGTLAASTAGGAAALAGTSTNPGTLAAASGGGQAAMSGSPVVTGDLGASSSGGQASMIGAETVTGTLGVSTTGGQASIVGVPLTGDLIVSTTGGRASIIQTGGTAVEDEWHPDGNLGALVWRPDFYAEPPLS